MLLLLSGLFPAPPARAAGEENGRDGTLTITVVEEIPAEDIEESAVPLADFPDSVARRGTRHAVMMGLTLLAVTAYVLYFSRYEKKLFLLRRQAARAEYEERLRRHSAERWEES